eukprot:CAMPEP_0170180686 /NCGR_PEP_ID=MMETSP0040_2-20121228/22701_1 /TAXON_ID=641309 /ORGANISM="Lotharella oceanica, Strain CCMP622" /LENGTH=124 /DNA_ID=CAMNT_0010425413 /DNA_START=44 /DNA_END=419 /DNA_ORIENTATION=-
MMLLLLLLSWNQTWEPRTHSCIQLTSGGLEIIVHNHLIEEGGLASKKDNSAFDVCILRAIFSALSVPLPRSLASSTSAPPLAVTKTYRASAPELRMLCAPLTSISNTHMPPLDEAVATAAFEVP